MPIRIALADDQPLVRVALRALAEADGAIEVVGEAGNGRELLELARRTHPDVAVVDIRMPVMDGLEATRQLALDPALSKTRVLILTTFEIDEYVFAALRAGASGFLLKDEEPAELLRAIRVIAQGDSLLSPSVTRRLVETFAARPAAVAPNLRRLDIEIKGLRRIEGAFCPEMCYNGVSTLQSPAQLS
jgi:DNA-binding NarL/FixJ family response regulator